MIRTQSGHTAWIITGLENYKVLKVGKKYENNSGVKSLLFNKSVNLCLQVKLLPEISHEEIKSK